MAAEVDPTFWAGALQETEKLMEGEARGGQRALTSRCRLLLPPPPLTVHLPLLRPALAATVSDSQSTRSCSQAPGEQILEQFHLASSVLGPALLRKASFQAATPLDLKMLRDVGLHYLFWEFL